MNVRHHRQGRRPSRGIPPRPRESLPCRLRGLPRRHRLGVRPHHRTRRPHRPDRTGRDSAGGNLAASVALRCRDTGRPLADQLLVYPAVDLAAGLAVAAVESGGIDANGADSNDDGFFTGQDDWVERQYLADDLSLSLDPRVSPMHAASHTDVAPAIIGIGHHDPLLDQNLANAKVLTAAGVPTVLREYPDLIHRVFGMGGVSASAERAADQLCQDLRTLLTNTSHSACVARDQP